MCAQLALPHYQPHPSAPGLGYLELYWNSAGEAAAGPTSSEAAAAATSATQEAAGKRQMAEVSPASSSSGHLGQFTADSAISPHSSCCSPQAAAEAQQGREGGLQGGRKGKSRTAFSKEQLHTLHQHFQSQKYLSPQQIRELAALLGLTYKQVKTWFQNRRMKLKRCQKHSLWSERAQCLMQSGFQPSPYLDVHPKFPQGYPMAAGSSVQGLPAPRQHYGAGHNTYTFLASEEAAAAGVFGKAAGTCSIQQTVGFIAQHKVDFYHSCAGPVEHAGSRAGESCSLQHAATAAATCPATAAHHL